ncbi:hypothetical protein [Alysiella crassa]|uniref:Uncharacterized protein n=1 Tax=Alysiella crassa TaxID=153491 RepID=A0A376BW92_9NEIS|nr:hypothetical protein [Alysiella crassa]UOP06530.1 hypothetical protein LVJ80_12340 [Alysiella crassa]SSY81063.1 Uncharacterised protein [Alysiella crassa]
MNDFSDFYQQMAATHYARWRKCAETNDYDGYWYERYEFETYRKAAGLPENWKPDDETE